MWNHNKRANTLRFFGDQKAKQLQKGKIKHINKSTEIFFDVLEPKARTTD